MTDKKAVAQELEALADFAKYSFSIPGALMAGSAAGLPLGSLFKKSLAPPWPPGIQAFCIIASVVVALSVFLFLREARPDRLQSIAKKLLFTGAGTAAFWLLLSAFFVHHVGEDHYVISGLALTVEAEAALSSDKIASETAKDLLNYFGWESADRAWTLRSISKFLIALSYVSFMAVSAGGFGALVLRLRVRDKGQLEEKNGTAQGA